MEELNENNARRKDNLLKTLQFLIDNGNYTKGSIFLEKVHKYQPAYALIPGHPVNTFIEENKQLDILLNQKILPTLKIWQQAGDNDQAFLELQIQVSQLGAIKNHYLRKENSLYPLLVKYELASEEQTSKLWEFDDDVRTLIKNTEQMLTKQKLPDKYVVEAAIEKLAYQLQRMVYQEETVLLPMLEEVVSTAEWYIVKQDEVEMGYCFISSPVYWKPTKSELAKANYLLDLKNSNDQKLIAAFREYVSNLSHIDLEIKVKDVLRGDANYPVGDSNIPPSIILPHAEEAIVKMEVGSLSLKEIPAIFNVLPIDLTFVDKYDNVKWFSNSDRIFPRTRSVIGRPVIRCHPPKSIDKVLKILDDFHNGYSDSEDFWVQVRGHMIYLKFLAVRDSQDQYLGCLETVQDITKLQGLRGMKTLENKDEFED